MTDTPSWIAQQIRDGRDRLGWTQAELARRLDRTQTAISYWEAGKRLPGVDDILALAHALGQDVDYFFPPDETRKPVSAILRAEAQRLASDEMVDAVEDLLTKADLSPPPIRTIRVGARQPAHAANELLEKAGVDTPLVPVEELAAKCGAVVLPLPLPDALSGLIVELDDGAVIGVNSEHPPVRRRFSVAHELGHHILGHGERFHIDVSEGHPPGYDFRVERSANEFAADLLMPRRLISREFERDSRTSTLASRFGVSELAMGYRLINLGLR